MNSKSNKPELLAPAGTLEKLKWAVAYGADAVYFGLGFGSLRNFAGNFTLAQTQEGLDHLHAHNKKGYVTLNIFPFSDEYEKMIETALSLNDMGVDGLIISDMGLLTELAKRKLNAALHVSTQANTTNWQTALSYKELGVKRINLARELSLDQIAEIQTHTAGKIETELFIHGAMCFSYSGRCAISDYMTGYRANRGECKHPCRYQYNLVEEKRPGNYFPVFEDERGLYLFNSKDLALWQYLPQLMEIGIDSFKIEGRMKTIHYLASVVSLYRQLIDGAKLPDEEVIKQLNRVPNRGYTAGFIKGTFGPEDYAWEKDKAIEPAVFVGNVTESNPNGCTIEVRNKIHADDILEILQPNGNLSKITMPAPLLTTENESADFVNNGQFLKIPNPLPEFTILRRT